MSFNVKQRLIWKLLATNIPIIAFVIVIVWLAIDYLAAEYFVSLMNRYHISPTLRFDHFIQRLVEVEARMTSINRPKIRRDIERARGPLSHADDEGPPIEARADVHVPTPGDDAALSERRAALWRLIQDLSAGDRLLVRLRFFEGLTAKQIAAAIGSTEPMEIYRRIERVCLDLRRRAKALGVDGVLLDGDLADLADAAGLTGDPDVK